MRCFNKHKMLILISLSLSSAVVFMDSAILPVALPTIQKQLKMSNLSLEWIINAYAIVLASLFLLGGKIGDLLGHRRIYCLGMIVFVAGAVSCGSADNPTQLILSRIFQGVGGALMVPSSMALVMENFHPQERGRCIGFLVSIASIFLSLAPFIGGAITELVSWRGVFWINLPLIGLALILALVYIPRSEKIEEPFDFIGFFYFASCIFAFVLGLTLFKKNLLMWSTSMALFGGGGGSFFFLYQHLKKKKYPFIDYKLFRNKTFRYGNLLIFCAQFLIMISAYWAMYFQKGLGFTPIKAGLFTLISSSPLIVCAPLSGYMCDHFGPRLPCGLGFIFTLFSFSFFCLYGTALTTHGLIWGLICFGIGVSLVMTSIGATTVGSIPSSRKGEASGIYGTIRNSATPFAVAVFGSMISNITFFKFCKKTTQAFDIKLSEASFYMDLLSKGALDQEFNNLPLENLSLFRQLFFESLGDAFFYCNLLCFFLSLFCFFITLFFMPCEIKNKINRSFN